MADQKISQLNELVTWADDDEFAIVDTDAVETKRMTAENVKANVHKGFLNLEKTQETIAAGVITASSSFIDVDTQGGGATDDLDTINGGSDGDILIIHPISSARTVVAKDTTGNLLLAGDFTMDHGSDTLMLIFWGTTNYWLELSRSNNA